MQCQLSNRAHRFDQFVKAQSLAQALTSLFWSIKHKNTPKNSLYVPNKPREAEERETAPPGHTLTLHALRKMLPQYRQRSTLLGRTPQAYPQWCPFYEKVFVARLCVCMSHTCCCCVRSCLVVFSVHIQHALRLEHCKTHQLHALQGLFSAVQLDS